jgi:hypothetical protein
LMLLGDALGATAVHVTQTFCPLKLYVTHMCRHPNSSIAGGLIAPIVYDCWVCLADEVVLVALFASGTGGLRDWTAAPA